MQSVAAYLAKMGMSERLYQEMMMAFNLSGEDPGYSEWRRARNFAKHGEAKMKEFDAWLIREHEHVARCAGSSSDIQLHIRCDREFQSRDPNPLFPRKSNK